MALPKSMFLELTSEDKAKVATVDRDGYINIKQTQGVDPFARFEVVNSTQTRGLVHILCTQTNKYWERKKDSMSANYWITATAAQPVEDQTKETCTLFRYDVDCPDTLTVRFTHVQSKCFLSASLWRGALYMLAINTTYDPNSDDLFRVIDPSSLLLLPKYVAFRSPETNQYLHIHQPNSPEYLNFCQQKIDPSATFESFPTYDGSHRFKTLTTGKFWKRDPKFPHAPDSIFANSDDTSEKDNLFRPVMVGDTSIALENLGNNLYCERISQAIANNFIARAPSSNIASKTVTLLVEEPITSRTIERARYDLDNAKVYDQREVVLDTSAAFNYTQQPMTFNGGLSYTDTKDGAWNTTSVTLKLPSKAKDKFQMQVPVIKGQGTVELSGERQLVDEWGGPKPPTSTLVQTSNQVAAPAMSKVTGTLIGTYGKCDVPYTFTLRDTLYDGRVVTTEMRGIYTGSNYYNIRFEAKTEQLTN